MREVSNPGSHSVIKIIHRGYYMSTRVILNLQNELRSIFLHQCLALLNM